MIGIEYALNTVDLQRGGGEREAVTDRTEGTVRLGHLSAKAVDGVALVSIIFINNTADSVDGLLIGVELALIAVHMVERLGVGDDTVGSSEIDANH